VKLFPTEFNSTIAIFRRYWKAYGGFHALFRSLYFYTAILISISTFSIWTKANWWDLPIAILPNLIGFSLGGYAVWLSFGDIKFRSWLCKDRGETVSIFMQVNAAFVHFICVQVLALIYGVIAKSLPLYHCLYLKNHFHDPSQLLFWSCQSVRWLTWLGAFVGFSLFAYSILCGLAATMAVFRFSGWLEWHTLHPKPTRRLRKRSPEPKQSPIPPKEERP